jgi:hypothetical protein
MKTPDRKKLVDLVNPNLPPGYGFDAYDDFLNYEWTDESLSPNGCRVARLLGSDRSLMVFAYDKDPTANRYHATPYRTLYLKRRPRGEAVMFDPQALFVAQRRANYEHVVGDWLRKRNAMSFHGKDWVLRLGDFLVDFIPRWEREFSKIASKATRVSR